MRVWTQMYIKEKPSFWGKDHRFNFIIWNWSTKNSYKDSTYILEIKNENA